LIRIFVTVQILFYFS